VPDALIPDAGNRQALAGIRVLDLSRLLPGPACSLLLADHGAEVVKVEDTGDGDGLRAASPAGFAALNRGKRSVRLDLKSAGGREALTRLAARADVLLESFRPGVMDRLGVGYERLRERNPRLVWCSLTGYGQEGPERARAGHDLNFQARAGALARPDGAPPAPGPVPLGDLSGALHAAFGILAALHARERTGEGQRVDVALLESALALLALQAADALAGAARPALGQTMVCYRPYACRDGWVAFAPLEPRFWRTFCLEVGREDLLPHQHDGAGSAAERELEALFLSRTREEWVRFGARHDCCLEPVLTLSEALAGLPLVAGRALRSPVRLSGTPPDERRAGAPALGEHTEEVLAEAGLRPPEVAQLLASGAAAGRHEGEPRGGLRL